MLKVLAKEPSARYRTADQLGRVLLNFAAPDNGGDSEPFLLPDIEQGKRAKQGADTKVEDIDWGAVGLGLLAALMVGGLLPFWMWVYLVYNPPLR
jgi:serine/threonine-protein kinase